MATNMIVKSITLKNFKGCENATYNFDGKSADVIGKNGVGKTTIATAFYWLFANKDYELNSNPSVAPIGKIDVSPMVSVVVNFDGKDALVEKMQKITTKEKDGVITTSTKNIFKINGIEYKEKDFDKKLIDYGFDKELFLALSHPDVFTNQKKDSIRHILFGMTSEKGEYEIAEMTENAKEVTDLFSNYTSEEIKAMYNGEIRTINSEYGKSGEILRAKIDGLEMSKSDIDAAELELGKRVIQEKIEVNKSKQQNVANQISEYQKLSDEIMKLKFEESDFCRKVNEENVSNRREIEDKISGKKFLVKQTESSISDTEKEIANSNHTIKVKTECIESLRNQFKNTQNLVFDENSLVCSYCGQEYPAEKKEQLKGEFENKKQNELKRITNDGNSSKAELDTEKERLKKLELELEEHKESLAMLNTTIAEFEKQLAELPASVDVSQNAEYMAIKKQIEEKEKALASQNSADEIRRALENESRELQLQLIDVEKQIAVSCKNVEIDEQISELKEQQKDYEQRKANAEKILHQLSLVAKKKNEVLTDEINKRFKLVDFRMFAYQKNGECVDDCTPTIDGKDITSCNGALQLLAKLDIIAGLQNFYKQHYPVFADDFSLVTTDTDQRIDVDCQLIKLKAVDGAEELRIEVK